MQKAENMFLSNLPLVQWDMVVITPEVLFFFFLQTRPVAFIIGMWKVIDKDAIAKSTF